MRVLLLILFLLLVRRKLNSIAIHVSPNFGDLLSVNAFKLPALCVWVNLFLFYRSLCNSGCVNKGGGVDLSTQACLIYLVHLIQRKLSIKLKTSTVSVLAVLESAISDRQLQRSGSSLE